MQFDAREENVKRRSEPPEGANAAFAKTMEMTQEATENYLNFIQKSMSASPWLETDFGKTMKRCAEKNVTAVSEFITKLAQARDFQDLARIHTEFMQTQLKSLSEQAKDLGETATKATTDAFKRPLGP
jgi:hypothetical protein